MNLESGDQIQLSDGNTYLYLFSLPLHGEEYLIFSSKENDDAFRLGKITKDGDKEKITFIFDKKLIEEMYDYVTDHIDEI
ncbi:hypothetical protein J6X15_02020 [Candidatus Saccharibacteria bacterium]|nr:hypothetical protein [Candidatus Saccharibacteria bacterium]MBP5656339.1 hypothetical protein [Candidatus Saccharibacteria bacterium]